MTQHHQSHVEQAPRRWLWLLLAFGCLTAVIFWLLSIEDTIDVKQTGIAPIKPVVSIEIAQVKPATVEINAFAEVRPRWSAELRAGVSGRVNQVTEQALQGSHVEQGATLIYLEDAPYVAEVAQAELNLSEARRQLLHAESETAVARRQYRNRGNKPANDLALKLPELEIAKQAVVSAKARLAAARLQRKNAIITAPFSGFVTERMVSPGQTVNAGEALIHLVDDSTLELTVEVSRKDWALLHKPISGRNAQLYNSQNQPLGSAHIRQGGGFLDQKSRQYRIFLEIPNASASKVLSGDYVRVALPGITVDEALNIPASALTQSGEIWYVDTNNQLQRLTPQILYRHQQRLVIHAPQGSKDWRIATTPLAAFLPGQSVNPQES